MNLTFSFPGQTVAVTGAAQGIGRAIARHFLDAGARVVVLDRDEERLRQAWGTTTGFVHLGGTFNFTRAVIPAMRAAGFGRIVNVTSYTGMHGNVGQVNYAAAKAGIIGMTKTVAKEVARFGITVNAISPNAATSMIADVPADKLAGLTTAIPQGRFADPEEMAATVAFLASREAGYITGAVLPVDGGMSM
jgi:3-oxoacyl-[acyl-carrier protein] reductase